MPGTQGGATPRSLAPPGDTGVPGQFVPETGVSVFAPNWDWHGVKLRELVEPELELGRVHVDNPLKAVLVAELWLGRAPAAQSLAVVIRGGGGGGTIACGGHLGGGGGNNAGEWGPTLLRHDGRACRCGRRGCIEAYVGVPGIQRTLAELDPNHALASLDQEAFVAGLATALQAEDPVAAQTLSLTADYLAAGLGDLVNFLNPDRVLLTGWAYAALDEWLLPAVLTRMAGEALASSLAGVQIDSMALAGNPVARGVALFALEDFLQAAGVPSRQRADMPITV